MSDIVLSVENLWKQYRLGVVGTGTLSHDLARWWALARGKEDPTAKIGGSNQLDQVEGEYVWALKDINFEVKQGEVLGVVGKNGAGKSTLLKILSKVTGPTKGEIKVKGRIASLLEVGTGFHPELTGRENIFLNGAILGMKKWEVRKKLDEIIEFAGIAKYADTPVKRYSSGMYVRLAFAVAAHLDPEILVVDEVLAVGDADFQKKAIGKMKDVSRNEGRTVLFVSHNMNAVQALCDRAITIKSGEKIDDSPVEVAIKNYLNSFGKKYGYVEFDTEKNEIERSGSRVFSEILSVRMTDIKNNVSDNFIFGEGFGCIIQFRLKENLNNPEVGICVTTPSGLRIHHFLSHWNLPNQSYEAGVYKINFNVDNLMIYPGEYSLSIWTRAFAKDKVDDFIENAIYFMITRSFHEGKNIDFSFQNSGGVYKESNWSIQKVL